MMLRLPTLPLPVLGQALSAGNFKQLYAESGMTFFVLDLLL